MPHFLFTRSRGSLVDYTEFKFDAVLAASATQADVYQVAAQPIVLASASFYFVCVWVGWGVHVFLNNPWLFFQQDVLEGYNGTIMAYGQTGAGKTYTLSDVVISEASESRVEGYTYFLMQRP